MPCAVSCIFLSNMMSHIKTLYGKASPRDTLPMYCFMQVTGVPEAGKGLILS